MRTRSCARANDANIVHSRNAQCKTRESPFKRRYGTLKYGDIHEKFSFLKIQDVRPLNTRQIFALVWNSQVRV